MIDKLIAWATKVLAFLAGIFAVYQAGKASQRADDTKAQLDIREEQMEVGNKAPRTKEEVMERLDDGTF